MNSEKKSRFCLDNNILWNESTSASETSRGANRGGQHQATSVSSGPTVYQRLSAHLTSVDLSNLELLDLKEISRETKSRVGTAFSSSSSSATASQQPSALASPPANSASGFSAKQGVFKSLSFKASQSGGEGAAAGFPSLPRSSSSITSASARPSEAGDRTADSGATMNKQVVVR